MRYEVEAGLRAFRTTSVVLTLCLLPPASGALAQRAAPPAPCRETAVHDTDAVWRQIDAQYARLADAMRRKDVDALFALYTPDYHVVMGNGEVWSRERSLEYQRTILARVRETHHIGNTIVRLTSCGDHATATVLQQWYRIQDMAGAARRVETNAVQDEHWTRFPDGWKRGDIGEIARGASFVDGKRVDITKPYDPDAPPYDPSVASSSR
jgi:ketosteroid isomerase-like protein